MNRSRAQAVAAAKRSKKQAAEAERLVTDAMHKASRIGADAHQRREAEEAVGEALAASLAAQAAAVVAAESMRDAFGERGRD